MRILFAAAVAAAALPAVPARAQTPSQNYNRNVQYARQDCNRAIRRAESRWQYDRAMRECRMRMRQANRQYQRDARNWQQYRNYDYNRYERGQTGYYADNYYRAGRY